MKKKNFPIFLVVSKIYPRVRRGPQISASLAEIFQKKVFRPEAHIILRALMLFKTENWSLL